MPRAIHEDMIGHQLAVILIRRSHIDLKSRFLTFLRERSDHIVRLKSGDLQHRYIHRLQEVFDHRNRFSDIFRSLGTLGFVLLIRLVAESATRRVKSHSDMRRVDLLQQIFERDRETENSRGVLPFAIHARRADKRIIRTEDHRIGVY